MEAYCFKCRDKVRVKNIKRVLAKNNGKIAVGVCTACGFKLFIASTYFSNIGILSITQ